MIRFPVSRPFLGDDEARFVQQVLDTNQLTCGPFVQQFEKQFANYVGVNHAVTVTSGTAALHLALAALDLGPDDEVLMPDVTFVATANAVRYVGGRVVLVDVDPGTWCMSLADAESKITARTRAILPVHLYGNPCDMDLLGQLARRYNLKVIEDAAEGLGGSYHGQRLGSFGNAGVFSFYGNKVMTTGEGGAVVTDSDLLAKRLRHLRGQAMDPQQRYYHTEVGFNFRMTDLQAAVGCGQLEHLDEMLALRREIFARYASRLCYHGRTPRVLPNATQAPWLFTLQVSERNALMTRLAERGIETRPVFVPMHRLPMYRKPDHRFSVSSALSDAGISLPTYPRLSLAEVDEICDVILERKDG